MLGNEAVARGCFEAGVRVATASLVHLLQKLQSTYQTTKKFTVNGHQMKR